MKQQIISIGGGGFSKGDSYTPESAALSKYFLAQTEKPRPSICFLPTASADAAIYIVNFYTEFTKLSCTPSHLSLFKPHTREIESFLLTQDAIYIGGGSTKNMLALWKEWEIDTILKKALARGVVLGGISAGMNCWYELCVTDSLYGELTVLPCLGFLKGSCCPHYDGEANRRPSYHMLMQSGTITPGIAIEDHTAVHYVNGEIKQVVTTAQSNAYQVFLENGKIIEKRLEALSINDSCYARSDVEKPNLLSF